MRTLSHSSITPGVFAPEGGRTIARALVVVGAVGWLGACVTAAQMDAAVGAARVELASSAGSGDAAATHFVVGEAVAFALENVRATIAHVETDPAALRRGAYVRLVAAQRFDDAALLEAGVQYDPVDAELAAAWIRLRIATERQVEARELAWAAARANVAEREAFMLLHAEAWRGSPEFAAGVATLAPGIGVDELRPFRGSSAVIMRIVQGDEVTGVFKPAQRLRHQYHRGEVATYRLCLLLGCDVEIPRSDEVRLLRDDFVTLLGDEPENIAAITVHNRELTYIDDPFGLEWIHGVRKAWVPSFCNFPIEYTTFWEPWVRGSTAVADLTGDSPVAAIEGLRGLPRANVDAVLGQLDDADVATLAHGLSDLHVLDYLANNYDRYQPENFLGMNLQFSGGHFVSIDNGATFPTADDHTDSSVWYRVQRVKVFSRETIESLRGMDTDLAYDLLFEPSDASEDDEARWDAFVARRERLLAFVDELIEDRGEDAVLVFP
jgi:hypothetical protein